MNKRFEDYLCDNYTPLWRDVIDKNIEVPFAQLWGVYLEFFDSVGIYINDGRGILPYTGVPCFEGHVDGITNHANQRIALQKWSVNRAFEILDTNNT